MLNIIDEINCRRSNFNCFDLKKFIGIIFFYILYLQIIRIYQNDWIVIEKEENGNQILTVRFLIRFGIAREKEKNS